MKPYDNIEGDPCDFCHRIARYISDTGQTFYCVVHAKKQPDYKDSRQQDED